MMKSEFEIWKGAFNSPSLTPHFTDKKTNTSKVNALGWDGSVWWPLYMHRVIMAGLQFLPLWVTDHLTDVPGCSPQIRVFVSSLCTPFCLRSPWLLWHSAPRYSSSQPNSPFLFTSISSQILLPHLVLLFYHIFSYTTPKITFP